VQFNLNLLKTKKILRAGIGVILGAAYFPIAWGWTRHPRDPLAIAVSNLLILGFFGSKSSSFSAKLLARQVKYGQVNGVFFVGENIGNCDDLLGLKALFDQGKHATLFAIDHEGGAVQRLSQQHGVTKLPRALRVGSSKLNFNQVKGIYAQAGVEFAKWGFNVNFGPVLDVHDPQNTIIGRYGRSFGGDTHNISLNAAAFVDGFSIHGIICVLKHFPGHGRSTGDSHLEPADITSTWSEKEIEPYKHLISLGRAPIIMSGHLRLDSIEPSGCPATLSHAIIHGILRDCLGFDGVVMTDDLDMEAITTTHNRRQALIAALKAGNDLIMIKNLFGYDPLLPKRALYWIREAIKNGELEESRVLEAGNRVANLKARYFNKQVSA
jgi:beta-N-acetylhexosaminidase